MVESKVKTNIPSFGDMSKRLQRKFRAQMKLAHKEAALRAVEITQRSIRNTDSVASGRLLNSVGARLVADSPDRDYFQSVVRFKGIDYAYYANYGRDAGDKPPPSAILRWMKKKGIPEDKLFAIVNTIGIVGTEGNHFIEAALPEIKKTVRQVANEAIRRFKKEI